MLTTIAICSGFFLLGAIATLALEYMAIFWIVPWMNDEPTDLSA